MDIIKINPKKIKNNLKNKKISPKIIKNNPRKKNLKNIKISPRNIKINSRIDFYFPRVDFNIILFKYSGSIIYEKFS